MFYYWRVWEIVTYFPSIVVWTGWSRWQCWSLLTCTSEVSPWSGTWNCILPFLSFIWNVSKFVSYRQCLSLNNPLTILYHFFFLHTFGFTWQKIVQISCGWRHTIAVTDKNNVYSWGRGTNGQLGHGDTIDR